MENGAITGLLQSGGTEADVKNFVASKSLASDFNNFLQLLTTQLKNQDPLEPLDTNEFTNQIVAFAGVEQQINMNSQLSDINKKLSGDELLSASSLVGKSIEFFGNTFQISEDGQTDITKLVYAHDAEVTDTTITIYDKNNQIVYTASGENAPGKHSFTWDGKDNAGNPVPPGAYKAILQEKRLGSEDYTPMLSNLVAKAREVISIEGDIFVNVGKYTIPFSDVFAVSDQS